MSPILGSSFPEPVRKSIHNVIALNEPVVFAQYLLQAKIERGGTTFAASPLTARSASRLFDVATKWG